jgi:16S rRNA (cytidine1402-2'-O)-methyltransferase
MEPEAPPLAIVATPIGNLNDFSIRAQKILRSVDYVLCEDTRRARKLKVRFSFDAPLVSFHEHNEKSRIPKILSLMKNGKRFALISDAGSPLVSDPGLLLVRRMWEEGLQWTFIPGANAVIAALILSGIQPQPFTFYGFLPAQASRRREILQQLNNISGHTLIFFESPDRVLGLLRELGETLGDRQIAVCREMTKLHEEVLRGFISELLQTLASRKLQGEFTVVVAPGTAAPSVEMNEEVLRSRLAQLEKEGYSRKDSLRKLARESGRSRNELYRLLMK